MLHLNATTRNNRCRIQVEKTRSAWSPQYYFLGQQQVLVLHNFPDSDISSKTFECSSMLNSVTCKMFGGLLALEAYFQFLPQHLSWSQMWALTRPLVLPHNPAFLLLFEPFFGGFTSVSLKAPLHLLDRWPHIIFKHSLL